MSILKKLALATAVTMLSSSVFAMEIAQDEDLSNATGQDGVTIGVTLPASGISFSTLIHDSDGIPVVAPSAGAIAIGDVTGASGFAKSSISSTGEILFTVDATGDIDTVLASTQPAVRINLTLTAPLIIHTGDIAAAKSGGLGVAVPVAAGNLSGKFLNDMTITIGSGSLLDITLGNEIAVSTGAIGAHMIDINTTLSGGLTLANFSLNDAGGAVTGGSLAATQIKMCDTSLANACSVTNQLQVKANIDIKGGTTAAGGGMILTLAQVGLTTGMDIEITALKFGDAATTAIGNVDIIGLAFGNNAADKTVIRIAGH